MWLLLLYTQQTLIWDRRPRSNDLSCHGFRKGGSNPNTPTPLYGNWISKWLISISENIFSPGLWWSWKDGNTRAFAGRDEVVKHKVNQSKVTEMWRKLRSTMFHNLYAYRILTVGWSTALQVGRSRIRFPMVSMEFFIDIIVLAALWPWVWLSF